MKTFRIVAGLALLSAGTFPLPGLAQQTPSEAQDLARYRRYAEAPVDHVRYFQVNGFQYLAPDTLAIRFGVNELYLLKVQTPCARLAFANGIALTAKNNTLYSNFDFVTFDHQRCKILGITPVNELKMKQDAGKAKAASASSGS
ncbi:MAG TPA: DUF6491 family protein [Rhodanobacteraceae bacterium]|jgi:hypothetical protein|nr:DUF6491 family protein [Rhodanobacteraceae bacterium]